MSKTKIPRTAAAAYRRAKRIRTAVELGTQLHIDFTEHYQIAAYSDFLSFSDIAPAVASLADEMAWKMGQTIYALIDATTDPQALAAPLIVHGSIDKPMSFRIVPA